MIRESRLPAYLLLAGWCCLSFGLVSDVNGQSAGLTTLWNSQVMIDGERDRIKEIHLHVHDDRADSYYEILYPGYRETISFDDLNPRGVPFRDVHPDDPGKGAMEWAELRKEILEAEGKTEVTVQLITVPRTTIYALTGFGGIHAIDAETGRTRWETRLGTPYEPTIGIASNNTHIIAVRGSRVYCLDALNGDEIWSRYAQYAPGGGVSMSDHYAYVTSVEGRLQMFPLNETGLPESFFASAGAATFDPAVTARTVSWPTERGMFNVARSNIVSLRYRLETQDRFQSPGTAVGEFLIANSVDGNVYALAEEYGSIVWEVAIGERLAKKPVAVGSDAVMIISSNDNLIALDARRGDILAGWPKRISGISEFVGASQEVIYFLDSSGGLVGLNRASGAMVSRNSAPVGAFPVPNHVTDRLYLAQPNGALVCLREIANINPVIMGDEFTVGNAAGEAEQQKPASEADRPRDPNDPFATGDGQAKDPDDPFATGGDPDDPFSGGGDPDDPFSGGNSSSDDKDDDPFGGGGSSDDDDDPFGGG